LKNFSDGRTPGYLIIAFDKKKNVMAYESEVENFSQRLNKRFRRNSSETLFPGFGGQMIEKEFNFAKGNGGPAEVLILTCTFGVSSFQDKFTKINEEIDSHEKYMVQAWVHFAKIHIL